MIRTTRTALLSAAAATALLTVAAPADAGAPTRVNAEYWDISCVADLGEGQSLFLFGSGTTDGTEGGVGAFVEDESGSQVAEGQATSFEFGARFDASVPLGARTLTIGAVLARGPLSTDQVDERDGNAWTKGTTSYGDLNFSGTAASYGGKAVKLDDTACSGDVNGFHVRTTNPSASIHRVSDFASEICDVVGLEDGQARLTGELPNVFVEVVLDHGGENVEKAQGEARITGGRGSLRTDVVDLFTGAVRTRATLGVALARSGKTAREVVSADGASQSQSVTPVPGDDRRRAGRRTSGHRDLRGGLGRHDGAG
ncbi:MAG: hypothetical protein ACJ72O_02590 [Marmoricola sp.]